MNWKSTKFISHMFAMLAATWLVNKGAIESVGYVTIILAALANYAYHDVKQKELK